MISKVELKEWGTWRIRWATKANLSECRELLRAGKLDGLGVSPFHGSDIVDLSDLAGIETLKSLVLPICGNIKLESLGTMNQLQHIVIGGAKGKIDLGKLSSLEEVSLDWSPDVTLPHSSSGLRRLRLDNFRPLAAGVGELARFNNLEALELVKGGIETLEGIEDLKKLQNVELHYMPKLASVRNIEDTRVEQLTLTHCKNVADLSRVAGCKKLRILRYHHSAPLPSIGFVDNCSNLEEFRFVGVDVIDGDLTPLVRIEEFAFTQKKHFSHTEKALRSLRGVKLGSANHRRD